MTRKWIALASITLLAGILSIGCKGKPADVPAAGETAAATVAAGKTLNVGFIPYDDIVGNRPDGKVGGYMVDVLNAALAAKGYDVSKVVYHETTWDAFPVGLDSGKYQLCIAGTFKTPVREKRVDFTEALFSLGNGALVRTDDKRFEGLKSVDAIDMDGITVSVVIGEYGHEYASKNFKKAKVGAIPGADLTQAPMQVLQKRADVAMSDQYVLRKFANLHPETRDALANAPYNVLPICWSVKKGNAEDLKFWNAAIGELKTNGKLAELRKKYERDIPFIVTP